MPERRGEDERRETGTPHPENEDAVRLPPDAGGELLEPVQGPFDPLRDREPTERAGDRALIRLRLLPEARIARPDAGDGPILPEPSESLRVRVFRATESEFQATLIAFSFSASVFSRES